MTTTAASKKSPAVKKAKPPKPKLPRGRWLLQTALRLHLAGTLIAAISLFLAEGTRPTFMFLYAPRHPFLILAVIGFGLAFWLNKKTLPPRVSPRTHPKLFIRKWHLTILEGVAILVSLFYLMGFHVGIPGSLSSKSVRLLTYNVYFNRLDKQGLCQEIDDINADITILQAADPRFENTLRPRFPEHTVRQDGEFIIMTKLKILKVDVPKDLPDELFAMYVRYEIETPAGVLNLYSVHPFSARHALFMNARGVTREEDVDRREVQIINFTEKAQESMLPTIIAGDWNIPEGSSIERRRLNGQFKDAFVDVGFGFGYTFPAKRPWMRIDRVLTPNPAKIRFGKVTVGPHANSDHRSLTVDFDIVN